MRKLKAVEHEWAAHEYVLHDLRDDELQRTIRLITFVGNEMSSTWSRHTWLLWLLNALLGFAGCPRKVLPVDGYLVYLVYSSVA